MVTEGKKRVRKSPEERKREIIAAAGKLIGEKGYYGTSLKDIADAIGLRIGSAIMAAASLSFLGFGANVSEPEWGAMLSQGRNYIGIASHMVYFPGLIIFITVLAFNLFGDGLRDTLDPKIK